MVTNSTIQTKGLSSRAQSKVEVTSAPMINSPPMVGVPALTKCPSGPSLRIGWPLPCFLRKTLISGRPNRKPKISAVMKRAARTEGDVAKEVEEIPAVAELPSANKASSFSLPVRLGGGLAHFADRVNHAAQRHGQRPFDQNDVARVQIPRHAFRHLFAVFVQCPRFAAGNVPCQSVASRAPRNAPCRSWPYAGLSATARCSRLLAPSSFMSPR